MAAHPNGRRIPCTKIEHRYFSKVVAGNKIMFVLLFGFLYSMKQASAMGKNTIKNIVGNDANEP